MRKSFLQSDLWLEFQKKIGRSVFKIQDINVIGHEMPMNKLFLYSPRLRPSDFGGQARFGLFIDEIKKIAKQEGAIFFKLELQSLDFTRDKSSSLEELGFRRSNNVQPLQTIILDLTKSEEELLSQMHPKTRYNINLAQKKEIKIRRGKTDDDFDRFWGLMQKTSQRDNFKSYSRAYYEEMLEIPEVELFLAEYENEAIVANIVVFCEDQAIYLHGASSNEHRNLMATPLLQWYQIQEAKRIGCTTYDFWGINEQKWPGVTRFKRGFGGQEIIYPGAYDLIFKPFWYKIYKIAKRIL